ncbi:MBL fold metallo-hydrolase [Prevotella brunnea]|uniref:MBL fold metallo-hydrolase RNA specificity domain-containing protein n=1 Tax=Prevotella brunnea TaxID=2508867 RepID=UPI002839CC36|nr:MBL fold metallo-hydrolase [Prevotella brunnea]
MVNIKVHRGLNQIGGCITEIWTDTSRVFVDFGQNLPTHGEPTTPEQDRTLVNEIIYQNTKEHQAVFYTHAHEDHAGLFWYIPIDQYIGEGSKEVLLTKYRILEDAFIKEKEQYCLQPERCPQKENMYEKECVSMAGLVDRVEKLKTWARTEAKMTPASITIGDIKVTPFLNCHSIYDSYMFLIEADGKRIWHTGDYREHGYLGKGLFPTLRKYATDIDVLITEGTMLKREDRCIHEREVSRKMASVMQAFKYVFVLASATDIERLAAIKEAAKNTQKPLCIWSLFMKRTMQLFTERESKRSRGLFSFAPLFYSDRLYGKLKRRGFAMIVGTSQMDRVKRLLGKLPQEETLLIYSSWDGYYRMPEQVKVNPTYKEFRELFRNVVDVHTSGHADRATIKKVIETVKPKKVICIHKEADAEL